MFSIKMLLTRIRTGKKLCHNFLEKNKFTSKIYEIFTLNDISNIEVQRKQILAYIFLIVGAIIGAVFLVINYFNQEYLVIAIDILILSAAILLFPFIGNQKNFKKIIILLTSVFYFIVATLIFISYKNQFYSLWFLATPPIFIFLLGNKKGTFVSLTHFSLFLTQYSYFNNTYLYPKEYFYRVAFSYFIILVLILIYEHTRKTVQTALRLHQKLLDNTIAKLDKQQVEYIKIMKNVNDGIFLLDQNLRIKSPYSTAFKNIISVKFITVGSTFISLLEDKIFQSKLIQLEIYLSEIVLTGHIPPEKVNPIEKIIVHCKPPEEHKIKTLSFSFTTIPLKNGKYEILGKVIDISKEVILEKKLNEQKTKKVQEAERLMTITRLHPEDLNEFIKSAHQKLSRLKEKIQETCYHFELHRHTKAFREAAEHPLMELITSILSEIHAIKGNASVIGFMSFAELVHRHEATIETLKKTSLKKEGLWVPQQQQLSTSIEKLLQEVTTTERIVYQLGEFNYRYTELSEKFGVKFSKFLYRAIQESKKEYHPPINLASRSFDETIFIHDKQFYETIKNIFILLIKNSLVHGIEPLTERESLKKLETATIKVTSQKLENGTLQLTYSDDGRGLNLELIKEHLLKNAKKNTHAPYREEQIQNMSEAELYDSIFNKEFSTRQTVSIDSGRGMGLYFAKDSINKLGGTINISSTRGHGIQFMFSIPLPQEATPKTLTLPAKAHVTI